MFRLILVAVSFAVCCTAVYAQEKEITNSIGMKLVLIPKGTFTIGSPIEEEGGSDNEEQGQVTIRKSFYLGIYEVTQGQYEKVARGNPSHFQKRIIRRSDSSTYPVEDVTWDDAVEFCQRLSALPEEKKAGRFYRLPTEAEWEYACRAGAKTAYCFGDNPLFLGDYAWYEKNSDYKTHPVGEKKPNAWGFYDMHGNVREWCSNPYRNRPFEVVTGPRGQNDKVLRVVRGGSFDDKATDCRSATRTDLGQNYKRYGNISNMGFRIALKVPEDKK
jgi:formylglycine-generating enzyme required for sulfatase activity